MNANVQFFSNPQFGNIRTLEINNKMWFGATDVATALGYSNPRKAIIDHCKSNGVTIRDVIDSMGRNQQMKFVNEGNVYRLVAKSELPKAEEFESWIFDEVIPSVIHTGGYIATKEDDTEEEIMARALIAANNTLAKREERIKNLQAENAHQHETINLQSRQLQEAAPKIQYHDNVLQSVNTYTSTQMAKELGMREAEQLHKALKEKGIMFKQSGQWLPTAKYSEKGYTKTRTTIYTRSDGSQGTNTITVWTETGRAFLHRVFTKEVQSA